MTPREDTRYKMPSSEGKTSQDMSPVAKWAYLFCSGIISTLIAFLSLLLIFALVSLLTTDLVPRINIPAKIPTWGVAIVLLLTYTIIVLPLKALRYRISPHKEYSLYGERPAAKYGDSTLWIALSILVAWYISEHSVELSIYLQVFPAWWRGFVDTVGPWFYQ